MSGAVESMSKLLPGILDSIDEGLIAVDHDGRILFMNRRFARMVGGITRNEWLGRAITELRPHFESHLPSADPLAEELGSRDKSRHALRWRRLRDRGLATTRAVRGRMHACQW